MTKPTEPGYYWHKSGGESHVVEVYHNARNNEFVMFYTGNECEDLVKDGQFEKVKPPSWKGEKDEQSTTEG